MAETQYQIAKQLLSIISEIPSGGPYPTYGEVATRLGRPGKTDSRAMASACDLLDAAACLAGVPALALVNIREKSGDINSDAWHEYEGPARSAIINRSLAYKFGPPDYTAIIEGLKELEPRGSRAAWVYVNALYPGDLAYRRMIGEGAKPQPKLNAIDDLGTDTPDRARSVIWSYARNEKVRRAVLKRANGKCEFCGKEGFLKSDGVTRYLETHHIIALANEGSDKPTNVIAVCANDHREAHFGARQNEIELGMLERLQIITSNS